MMKTPSVHAMLYVMTNKRYSGAISISKWKCSQYSSQRFEQALPLSTLGSKTDNSQTQRNMTPAGNLIIMADHDFEFLTIQSLSPQLKCLQKEQFISTKEVTAKVTRALTDLKKWFPGMLPKVLHTKMAKCVTAQGNYI
jgi:hypothetical protein